MARIVVAGAGAIGASIAYHLALLGAREVVLADRAESLPARPARRWAAFRQQFSTEAEVRLAQASAPFFRELGSPLFDPVGYLFLATSDEGLEASCASAPPSSSSWASQSRRWTRRGSRACARTTSIGAVACWEDGVAEPAAVTRELVRRAVELGVDVREQTDARRLDGDVLVIACGAALARSSMPSSRSGRSADSSSTSARSRTYRTTCR